MSTTVVKTFSASLGSRRDSNKPGVIQPEHKHKYLLSTPSKSRAVGPAQQTIKVSDSDIPRTQPNKPRALPTPSTSESDGLDCILAQFRQTVLANPNISTSIFVCKKVIKFIAKPNRETEYAFFGVGQVEYDVLERFIEETSQISLLRPRLTHIAETNSLLVEMPSALHEAPFAALHSDFSDFFKRIPYN
ncbi:hypothetical protein EDD22DRAFT_962437 [Suillus occidentalis]|nr:hypothetical protein EDD22DRAFT_962437 [Suillus occidentalis]